MPDGEARATAAGHGTLVAPTRMRTAIAREMARSKREVPHFYVAADVVMDPLLATARDLAEARADGPRITVTALLVHRLAATLARHPAFNAVATDEGFVRIASTNIGIAIALDEGLIAPALLDCGSADLPAIATRLDDLVGRARAGRLRATELTGATFTLSNLGAYPVTWFAAIVPPPQVAILAIGRAELRPAIVDGTVVARRMLTATLSADHRAVDGAAAGAFLRTFKELIEESALSGL
jgi:pyruvate dehydrogenase E2 component (dihydrolipoamide acetyltransferase)